MAHRGKVEITEARFPGSASGPSPRGSPRQALTTTWLGYSAIELVEALEDAQTALRDLEYAVGGTKDPPEDLVEAVDRVRRAFAYF